MGSILTEDWYFDSQVYRIKEAFRETLEKKGFGIQDGYHSNMMGKSNLVHFKLPYQQDVAPHNMALLWGKIVRDNDESPYKVPSEETDEQREERERMRALRDITSLVIAPEGTNLISVEGIARVEVTQYDLDQLAIERGGVLGTPIVPIVPGEHLDLLTSFLEEHYMPYARKTF